MTAMPMPNNRPLDLSSEKGQNAIEARLERLHPAMTRIAHRFADLGADDLYQEMAEFVILNPHFEYDYAALHWAKKRCLIAARQSKIHAHYVCPMPVMVGEDDELIDFDEFMVGPDANPEDELIARETLTELLQALTPTRRLILDLLMQGYRSCEIASILELGANSISANLKNIRSLTHLISRN